jgi:hypothetical protein
MKVILTFPTGERMQYTVKNQKQADELFRQAQIRFSKPYYQKNPKTQFRRVKMEIIESIYIRIFKLIEKIMYGIFRVKKQ